jgi:hypothetical protein
MKSLMIADSESYTFLGDESERLIRRNEFV